MNKNHIVAIVSALFFSAILQASEAPDPKWGKAADNKVYGQKLVNEILIADPVKDYIVEIVHTSRNAAELLPEVKNLIRCGASPRGTINLALASRALAFLAGRSYVTPQDIKDLALDVLRHRILVTYEAEAEGVTSEQIVNLILNKVPVP